jgi:RNA polymerase sigma-70 factor (ECF subfamily)
VREVLRGEALVPLGSLFHAGTCAGLTDGELLERYTTRRGIIAEAAFTALVERHGPSVLRLCRGVLRDRHAAEDAFQATFLVLARRAGSIRRKESVGPWLRGVALRVAGCARSAEARRQRHERAAAAFAPESFRADEPADGTVALLEELGRLPEKFRAPLVLCYLEGMNHDDVAVSLGWPLGTVRSRLARGRERLRLRLARRGLAPALAAWATTSAREASAAVPPGLVQAATQAAVGEPGFVTVSVTTLAEEVLRIMTWMKLKVIGASVLAVGFAAAGAGVVAQQAEGRGNPATAPPRAEPVPATPGRLPEAGGNPPQALRARDRQVEVQRERIQFLEDRTVELESALKAAKRELAEAVSRVGEPALEPSSTPRAKPAAVPEPEERLGIPALDRRTLPGPGPDLPVDQYEERLRRIERMLEQMLAERRWRASVPIVPLIRDVKSPSDEDLPRVAAWDNLTRNGFIGRFDAEPVNAVRFLTELYHGYVGRKPTPDEVAMLARLTGPGHEQWTAEPETIVRRLFQSDWFAGTALGQALLVYPTRLDPAPVAP